MGVVESSLNKGPRMPRIFESPTALQASRASNPVRLPGLDGIRALSIAAVIIYHVGWSAGLRGNIGYGAYGVHVFFVLSGFLITHLLCQEEQRTGRIDLKDFYRRRAFRILPPVIVYLSFLVAMSGIGALHVIPSDLLHSLLFTRNLFDGPTQTSHFWSLAIEEQFYFLWPSIMILLGSNRTRLVASTVLFLWAPIWRQITYRIYGGAANVNLSRGDLVYDVLLAGCILALLRNDERFGRWMRGRVLQGPAIPLISLVFLPVALSLPGRSAAASRTCSSVLVALFINYTVDHPDGLIARLLNARPVVTVGILSYSLYIWQQAFCYESSLPWIGQFPQNVAAAVALSAFSYYLVERPCLRFRKRQKRASVLLGETV